MAYIKAGDAISTTWWPEAVTVLEDTDQLDITSTSATAGSPACSTTFVAPSSGRVGVAVAAEMRESAPGSRLFVGYELYEGTSAAGTLKQAYRVQFGVSTSGDTTASEFMTHGNMTMVEGLTAGATHFIRTMHQTEGGATNDIGHRRLVVIPLT